MTGTTKPSRDSAQFAGQVNRMFDRVASRYDALNSLMSAGLHHRWRERAADRAELRPGYRRPDSDTFLQHPEWYIVYSSEEYGRHLASHRPSAFPYGVSIGRCSLSPHSFQEPT